MNLNLDPETIAFILASLAALRLIGEAFKKIATVTKSKTDDKVAGAILSVLDNVGRLLAWFGIGNAK